ncbi:MAG: DUF3784 domain-containing protein [Oscillospiraceae bacterium]|jgi:hypothetical protein|nr:DUF3784 domain-containing protein [Oscillospiraceae bacterium]
MAIYWIVTIIIALPFTIMGIFMLSGKGAFLIAGFNTMSESKKATYDKSALCRAVGILLISLSVLVILFPVASSMESMWLFWIICALFMVIPIGFIVYANTGNRFRINVEPLDDAIPKARKPMSKMKKVGIVVVVAISVQVFIAVGVMLYQGEKDPEIIIGAGSIEISALYGLTVNMSEISEITLVDKSMMDIGIGRRTNGYSSGGPALKGNFSSDAHGMQLLFVYSTSSPTIRIDRPRGATIFISFRDGDTTLESYLDLSSAFAKSTLSCKHNTLC